MGNNQSEREYEEIRLKQTISLAEEQLKQALCILKPTVFITVLWLESFPLTAYPPIQFIKDYEREQGT